MVKCTLNFRILSLCRSFFGISFFVLLFAGCSSDENLQDISGTVTVRVPWLKTDLDELLLSQEKFDKNTKLDSVSSKLSAQTGKYDSQELKSEFKLSEVRLQGISSLADFSGSHGNFIIYPELNGSEISGEKPKTRFFQSAKKLFIPMDYLSAQVAILYGNIERLHYLSKMLGLKNIQETSKIVVVSLDTSSENVNNAFYNNETDALFFVPYLDSHLPIAINPGIIAHEYFHSIYNKIVYAPLVNKGLFPKALNSSAHGDNEVLAKMTNQKIIPGQQSLEQGRFATSGQTGSSKFEALEKEQRAYSRILIQGINEGFADTWGWVYTGLPDFIALSLPSEKANRTLISPFKTEETNLDFKTHCELKRYVQNVLSLQTTGAKESIYYLGESYKLGTEFARAFKLYAEVLAAEKNVKSIAARISVAKKLISFLPKLSEIYGSNLGLANPITVLSEFGKQQNFSQNECQFFLKYLNNPNNDGTKIFECQKKDGSLKLVETENKKEVKEVCQ